MKNSPAHNTPPRTVISLSPFRCRMWPLHDRLESHVTEESCRGEIDSIKRHGQLVPVLGRPLRGDAEHDVELIFGARRLFVTRHLNLPLLVEVREISDREAIVAMDIENRHRVDISPYERGLSYARWLRHGQFASQDDLARSLGVSSSHVSRLLKLSRLPSAVVSAFAAPTDIYEGWGLELIKALDDPQRRQPTLELARKMAAEPVRPQAREVYQRLLVASLRGRRVRTRTHDEVVKDTGGEPLFRIRHQNSSLSLVFPLHGLSAEELERIRAAIINILRPRSLQTKDCQRQPVQSASL
jgi:ParB family transcriptional regulator, chromosome partitioning protein